MTLKYLDRFIVHKGRKTMYVCSNTVDGRRELRLWVFAVVSQTEKNAMWCGCELRRMNELASLNVGGVVVVVVVVVVLVYFVHRPTSKAWPTLVFALDPREDIFKRNPLLAFLPLVDLPFFDAELPLRALVPLPVPLSVDLLDSMYSMCMGADDGFHVPSGSLLLELVGNTVEKSPTDPKDNPNDVPWLGRADLSSHTYPRSFISVWGVSFNVTHNIVIVIM